MTPVAKREPAQTLAAVAEESLQHLVHSLLPMAVLTLDGNYAFANDAVCRLLQRNREELIGQPLCSQSRTSADHEAVRSLLATAATRQRSGDVTQELLTADGHGIPLRLSWTLGLTVSEEPAFLTVVFLREGGQGAAERALAATEARARAVLMRAADITWTADAEGVVLSVTAVPALRGWAMCDALGRRAADLVHASDLPAFESSWDRVVRGVSHRDELECRLRQSDETWAWVRMTLTDLTDVPHAGTVLGHVVDISESRRRRQRSEDVDRRRTRFEQSRAAQARVDLHGTLVAANASFCALVEKDWDALRGVPLSRLGHKEDDGRVDGLLAQVLAGRQESAQSLLVVSGSDSRPVSVSADITLLRDADGEPAGAAVRLYDLTALHDTSRQRDLQEEFVAGIARLAGELAFIGDADGQLIYVSAPVTQLLGYSQYRSVSSGRVARLVLRLRPVGVVGAFDVPLHVLAFDDPGRGA